MSYDLFLGPRSGQLDLGQLANYFGSRDHYRLSEQQAFYLNPDSGVYLGFEFEPASKDSDPLPVSFNINFFRPSYFILEAELEVCALVRHFDLIVFDPQVDGMGEGEYQSDLLIKGWNSGNHFAFASFLKKPAEARKLATYPAATLTDIWRWNLARSKRQAQAGDGKYVPRAGFLRIDGTARSFAFWPDGIPTVIPPVDYLIVGREQLRPVPGSAPDQALLTWRQARPLLERHGAVAADNSYVPKYDRAPDEVVRFLRSLPAHAGKFEFLSSDQVLDVELVEQFARETIVRRFLKLLAGMMRGRSTMHLL
jgi:hypothetical protein